MPQRGVKAHSVIAKKLCTVTCACACARVCVCERERESVQESELETVLCFYMWPCIVVLVVFLPAGH